MKAERNLWDENQRELRAKLPKAIDFENMRQLLLTHHAKLHAAAMADAGVWSYADAIWEDLTDAEARQIPPRHENSIVWACWHMARIEDITVNLLAAGRTPVLEMDNWLDQLNIPFDHTGNRISESDMTVLNEAVNIDELRAYRLAVGRSTQALIKELKPAMTRQKPNQAHVEQLRQSGTLLADAIELADFWSKRTIVGLLLTPATRHNMVHLNESARIKQALRKQ